MKTIFNEDSTKENTSTPHLEIDGKRVYYKEIVHPIDFIRLYKREKPIFGFVAKVNTLTPRPFSRLSSEDRKLINTYKDDVIIIRLCKEKTEVEFVTKIYEWGIIRIPRKIIDVLTVKNLERICIKIIAKDHACLKNHNKIIDMANIANYNNDIKIIPRLENFVTLYYKKRIPITLPRFIKLSSKLIELLFLIHGDGHYKSKLYFVNKFPDLHKFVLDEFENIFRVPKDVWRYRMLLYNLDNNKNAKEYWKKSLELNELQFYNSSKSKLKTSAEGNLRIIIDKTLFSLVFRFVFDKIKSKMDRETALHALNGLLCAEGGAQVSGVGLHKITLSFNQQEKELFKRIMCKAGIFDLFKEEQNSRFVIQGWSNLYLFLKTLLFNGIIPFRIHDKRKERAVNGFLNHSFTKTMVKYLTVINKNNYTTPEKLSQVLDLRRDSLLETLRKEQYRNFIKIKGKGINRNPFILSISKEGKDFLKLVKYAEKTRL